MAISNISAIINADMHKVWDVVYAVDKYPLWRSDLSKTEILNEKQFIEYTKDGYATTFITTAVAPYKRWEFDMENSSYAQKVMSSRKNVSLFHIMQSETKPFTERRYLYEERTV